MPRLLLCVALALLLVACSSNQAAAPRPAPGVAPYGPSTQRTYQPPAAPSTVTYGAFAWHDRIADAQAQARRDGKLILVGSTQSGCSLCEKFKNTIVPGCGTQVSSVAIGYMVNARSPESPQVWRSLRANLPNEHLMPLVGVFTPDLRYLTGFGGPPDSAKLLRALSTARGLYPISPVSVSPPTVPIRDVRRTAQLNEYGEYEWTPLEDLEPVDALQPSPDLALDAGLPPAPAPQGTSEVTEITPVSLAASPLPPEPDPVVLPVVAPPVRALVPAPEFPVATEPAAPPPPAPPATPRPEPAGTAWGERALRTAFVQIRDGEFEQAKTTLAEVSARLPGSTLAREATKGQVALYNAQRIQSASGYERELILEEAQKNLASSMWRGLFESS